MESKSKALVAKILASRLFYHLSQFHSLINVQGELTTHLLRIVSFFFSSTFFSNQVIESEAAREANFPLFYFSVFSLFYFFPLLNAGIFFSQVFLPVHLFSFLFLSFCFFQEDKKNNGGVTLNLHSSKTFRLMKEHHNSNRVLSLHPHDYSFVPIFLLHLFLIAIALTCLSFCHPVCLSVRQSV